MGVANGPSEGVPTPSLESRGANPAEPHIHGALLPGGGTGGALAKLPLEPLHEPGHHGVRDPRARLLRQVDGPPQFFNGPHVTATGLALLLQLETHE